MLLQGAESALGCTISQGPASGFPPPGASSRISFTLYLEEANRHGSASHTWGPHFQEQGTAFDEL